MKLFLLLILGILSISNVFALDDEIKYSMLRSEMMAETTRIMSDDKKPQDLTAQLDKELYNLSIGKEISIENIRALLKKGANPKGAGKMYQPLYVAAGAGNIEVTQLLLDYKVDVNYRPRLSGTALNAAAFEDNYNVVKLLLKYGADPCIRNPFDKNSIDLAKSEKVKKLLLDVNDSCPAYVPKGRLEEQSWGGSFVVNSYSYNGKWGNFSTPIQIEWIDTKQNILITIGKTKKQFNGTNLKYREIIFTDGDRKKVTLNAEFVGNKKIWSNLDKSIIFSREL